MWQRIVEELRRLMPLRGVMLYGSSLLRRGRDYDVLVVTDDPEWVGRRDEVERAVSEAVGARVDVNVATPRGILLHEVADPYIWHVLASGVCIGDVPRRGYPLSRYGAWHALETAKILLEDADNLGLTGRERAEWLRPVAKQVAALEQALAGRADPESYRRRVRELHNEAELRQAVAVLEDLIESYPPNEADKGLERALSQVSGG